MGLGQADTVPDEGFVDQGQVTETEKRPPGRPKGHPKSGGRAKGVPNKPTQASRERIMKTCDPIDFLCKVVRGDRQYSATRAGSRGSTGLASACARHRAATENR